MRITEYPIWTDTDWVELTSYSSDWRRSSGQGCWYRRKGNVVTITINANPTKTLSSSTIILTLPSEIRSSRRIEYGSSTNGLLFNGNVGIDGAVVISPAYKSGSVVNWTTSNWVGFNINYTI